MREPDPEGASHKSSISARDLFTEAMAALLAKPTRLLLTGSGTVLGIAALVAIAGLTTTAGDQIVSRLDVLAATEVTITPAEGSTPGQPVVNLLPWDAESRLMKLNGVVAAGTLTPVEVGDPVRTIPITDPSGRAEQRLDVFSASPALVGAVQGIVSEGRWFDSGDTARGDAVAVLGVAAAQRLGVVALERQPAIFIGDIPLTIVGILGDTRRKPELLDAVIVPDQFARSRFGLRAPGAVHVHTALGAARMIGGQAPIALAPQAPELLQVRVPPEQKEVRAEVADDLRALFLLLGAVSLLVGGLGIANTTLVGVLERTAEIGLRRSLGAYRSHVAVQFLLESTAVGTLGGIVGTSLGVLVVVGVSAARSWSPVLDAWVPFVGVVMGTFIGLAAGTYPAWRGVERRADHRPTHRGLTGLGNKRPAPSSAPAAATPEPRWQGIHERAVTQGRRTGTCRTQTHGLREGRCEWSRGRAGPAGRRPAPRKSGWRVAKGVACARRTSVALLRRRFGGNRTRGMAGYVLQSGGCGRFGDEDRH